MMTWQGQPEWAGFLASASIDISARGAANKPHCTWCDAYACCGTYNTISMQDHIYICLFNLMVLAGYACAAVVLVHVWQAQCH